MKIPYLCKRFTGKDGKASEESLFSYQDLGFPKMDGKDSQTMMFKDKVEGLLQVFLDTRPDLFLISLKISAGNDIVVTLDGDQGVSLQDCLDASRAIENNLDREEEDFSLQVMSGGLSEPLTNSRQFVKNMGRDLDVILQDEQKISGEIVAADENGVTLMLRYRKPKDIGKGKVDVEEEKIIPYSEIKKALVAVKF